MVPPLSLANMLLAGLIIVSLATSVTCSTLNGVYFPTEELDFESRNKIIDGLNTAKEITSALENLETITGAMKGVAKFASAMPFIGPVFAIINMVILFVPQHDPVLKAVTDGFGEVNRKLDSLSMQMSNLATDVEWYNYASAYSQDEVRILSAWNKYEQFFRDHNSNDKNYLAKVFADYYEYTQVESSVDGLYHYLTVKGASLSGNLNNLLRKKFKCDLKKILNYNMYFNSLLMKGIALNNFYWNLIGFNKTTDKDNQMFKNVFAAQSKVVDFCLKNHMNYVKQDVVEIAKLVGYDNLQRIADKVKGFLDDKYGFYKWVVLAYKSSIETEKDNPKDIVVYETMTKIPIDKDLTVAVAYTHKTYVSEPEINYLRSDLRNRTDFECHPLITPKYANYELYKHRVLVYGDTEYAKITHAHKKDQNDGFAENPPAPITLECVIFRYYGLWPIPLRESIGYKTAVYPSRASSPCDGHNNTITQSLDEPYLKCQNNGTCKRLLGSTDALCECQDGFYGDTCERKGDIKSLLDVLKSPLSTVKPISVGLADIESKLNEILNKKVHCQH